MELWDGIASIKLLPEYLDALKTMTNCVIIVCVRDNAGYWLDESIQSRLEALGLRENLIQQLAIGYIGIVQDGNILYEQKTAGGPTEYTAEITGRQFHVYSAPWQKGDHASVTIDGAEYAINSRGLNFVVYDPARQLVLDAVAFDTHVQNFACSRMKDHYDVALVGYWFGANYGSILNGYAVYRLLRDMGHSVLMIHKPDAARDDWEITHTHNARFFDRFYPPDAVSPCLPLAEMNKLNQICDTFMSGSDQLWKWHVNRIFKLFFMQNFVEDSKKRISFATSFGIDADVTPPDQLPRCIELLRRFHAISVREKSGVDICRRTYGIQATEVIEPVFCLTRAQYDELAEQSQISTEGPYMLAYILDPTPEKRAAIQYYSKISGLRAYIVPDGDPRLYERNRAALNLPDVLAGIGAEDFLRLYRDCAFVLTDSFHGTAFSVIFNKPFLSIPNPKRGAVRFGELLGKFALTDHLAPDSRSIPEDPRYLEAVDYTTANQVIQAEAERAVGWLRYAVETPKEQMPSIILSDKSVCAAVTQEQCTGCAACVNACPTDALSLRADKWGYLRRAVDDAKCINCEKCVEICPALSLPSNHNMEQPDCYEFVAADTQLLYASSSGGAFAVMAREAFRRGGVVCGVAWTEDFRAENILISRLEDLPKLQKSKYFQSNPGLIHRAVKEKLEAGVFVLFTGTPCQTAGLRAYLGKDYENLIAVDILCGNAPSREFFQKYLKEAFPDGIKAYEFRPKSEKIEWRSNSSSVRTKSGDVEIRHGGKQDDWQRAYHPHIMTPKHCETCRYQRTPRFGDLSMGDFWGIQDKDPQLYWKKGVSVILCNNLKGKAFLQALPENEIHVRKQVPLDWLGGNGYALKDWKGAPQAGSWHNYASPKRDRFYQAIQTMPFSQALDYATKPDAAYKNRLPSADSRTEFLFDTHFTMFRFNPDVWEQAYIRGALTLFVKDGKSRIGNYAVMPLFKTLQRGQVYTLKMRFKTKTESDAINFHVKDSGSNVYQIIYSYRVDPKKQGQWIDVEITFQPDAKFYDEFMIGAAQIKGVDNYIGFDYVYIYRA